MKGKNKKSLIYLNFLKNHKKIMISLIVVITFLSFFLTINYGRYVKNIIEVYYLRTKNFYFNSDKLTINGKKYEIYPWEATDPYIIDIEVNSLLNDFKGTDSDVPYKITCNVVETSYKDKVGCSILNTDETGKRTIYKDNRSTTDEDNHHRDYPQIKVEKKSDDSLRNGDTFKVEVVAKSEKPYVEELSATFVFIVGNYGIRYVVENTPGNIYFDAIITNTLPPNETVNVSLEIIELSKIEIDMSNNILKDEEKDKYSVTKVINADTGDIQKISFNLDPKSSMKVRFYKRKGFDNTEIDKYLKFNSSREVVRNG